MKRNYFIVGLIFIVFFVISLLTNIIGPIIPDIIKSFDLSYFMVAFLPFSFFIAYLMSIPAGMLIEKYHEKLVMSAAFLLAGIGALLFAVAPVFSVAVISLFLIGFGMAMLQVAINPLLRTAGGEEHFAFNSVFAQLFFGGASFLSPQIYSYLVQHLQSGNTDSNILLSILAKVTPIEFPWVSLYWLFTAIALLMVVVVAVSKLPKVELKEDEKTGAWGTIKDLFKQKTVILYFIGIFAYVGSEQGIANWISEFLSSYHGYDPQTTGADTVSYYWGLLTVGCLLGLVVLKLFDSKLVLKWFTGAAMLSLAGALFSKGSMSLYLFPATGFFLSVMWSIVFSLALNSMDKHHGSFSGILCTGIIGGAVVPLIVGSLGDLIGLRFGMLFLFVTLGYIFSIGFWAKPLISNETIFNKEK
ncbi:MAG: MFS transporter [Ignavibacteria bacterium]|jgi:fucose permease